MYIEDYFLDIARDLRSAVDPINIDSRVYIIGYYQTQIGVLDIKFAQSIRE